MSEKSKLRGTLIPPSEKPQENSRLRGSLITPKEPTTRLRGSLIDRSRTIKKIETIEDFRVAITIGSKFESTDYKYEVTSIKDERVATKKFDKTGKFLATQTFSFDSLWEYYQEGRISISS